MIQRILIFILVFNFQSILKADCLACWESQFIQIEFANGDIKNGFMLWNHSWLLDSKGNYEGLTSFCDTIVEFYNYNRLEVYKKIRTFHHLLPNIPIAVNKADTINLEHVINLKKYKHELNNLQGAISIPIITKEEEIQLSKKPLFIYKTFGEGLSDAYYFNYNPKIKEEELENLIISGRIKYYKNIIKIEIHYD